MVLTLTSMLTSNAISKNCTKQQAVIDWQGDKCSGQLKLKE
ncbi:hypothetical protein QE197_22710 (plasmid) [Arsenophonus nasoniae]|nr:hypothetical protein [Arsenophonus nasoniae]WGM13239.1 hypothetical protein QE197_22710 [Arsenophonus nasoniae]